MTCSWDELFMSMVFLVATKSKDENTHIGAVIVGPDNEVRSVGYNGFARGIYDDNPERQQPPEKYFWFEHAERNAIYNATLMGVSLKGCRMYTNGIPCMDCARGVVQSGIKEVIVHEKWNNNNDEKWKESCAKALQLFGEAKVGYRFFDKPLLQIKAWRKGKEYAL